ncbi:MAG: thioesterase family protein [Mycobacterium sp.]
MTAAFYRKLPAGEGTGGYEHFESTGATCSTWSSDIQHGSPPLALLTRAIEQQLAGTPLRIGRLNIDILGAVPVAPVTVRSWVERPGKRISLLAAEMATDRPVARVTAWALATSDTHDVANDRYPPLVEGPPTPPPAHWWDGPGYLDAMDWRPQPPSTDAAVSWVTPQVQLVEGETPTLLQNLTMVVDSANGIGAMLDTDSFVFMNTDTVVHLHRLPTGRDIGVRARASIGPDGVGVTNGEIFDRVGFVGTTAQTLLVQRQ